MDNERGKVGASVQDFPNALGHLTILAMSAYPYVAEVWGYDAARLRSVRGGERRPWRVKPYATWRLPLPYGSGRVGGAAYDGARGLIYVSQQYADGPAPVVHAFALK